MSLKNEMKMKHVGNITSGERGALVTYINNQCSWELNSSIHDFPTGIFQGSNAACYPARNISWEHP